MSFDYLKQHARQMIRRHRLEKGWTFEDLESLSGVSRSTIYVAETGFRGRGLRMDTLRLLATALQIPIDTLMPLYFRARPEDFE